MMDFFGRYCLSQMAKTTQAAKTISTITLQAKALVVMNGKKKELETRNGTNGMRKSPTKIVFRRICLFIDNTLPVYTIQVNIVRTN